MVNQQLIDYIKQQSQKGLDSQKIIQSLIANGWDSQDIDEAYIAINNPSRVGISNKVLTISVLSIISILLVATGGYFYIQKIESPEPVSLPSSNNENEYPTESETTSLQEESSNLSLPEPTQTSVEPKKPIQEPVKQVAPPVSQKTSAKTLTIQCSNVKFTFPEKWSQLEPSSNSKLDSNGCVIDANSCLCAKKDPHDATKGVIFGIIVTTYPDGFTLDDLISAVGGTSSDIDKSDFLGNQAVKFTQTSSSRNLGVIGFFKNNLLYEFDLRSSASTFDSLWPDFTNSIKSIQFN